MKYLGQSALSVAFLTIIVFVIQDHSVVFAQRTPASSNQRPSSQSANPVTADVVVPPVDPAIELGIKQAVTAFNNSDFSAALEQLNVLYAKFPNLAPPRIVLAQWYAQANLGEAVRASLEMATVETPNDPEAYVLLGEILLRQRYLTAAELLYQTAEAKLNAYDANPERKQLIQASLLRNAIMLAETRGRWETMIDLLDQVMKQDGETATQLRQKGIALFQQEKDAEALSQFIKADNLAGANPSEPDTGLPAEAAIAQLYQLRGDKVNAQKYLAEALVKYPLSKEVVVLSIQARINEDQLENAHKLAEKLLTENPTWQPAKRLLATVALYLGDFAEAEKLFQELILESPSDEQVINGLALAQCEQGDPLKLQLALEYARENVRKNQQESDYWATLGWVLYKADQMEQAGQALKQAAATGRVNAATAYYLSRLALRVGQSTEAVQFLEAAIDSPAPFAKRRDAAKLLNELKK
ncbi:MAG: tetratricopeptide repeat protein [Planctomycetaceae bacterium]|nr:tetratricopeptide repeat protein [Planctomycetaceae bacterium]